MKNIAVILAGGTGSRLKALQPKQYIKVAGKMVIEHTIEIFENNKSIDEIAIVASSDYHPLIDKLIIENEFTKVTKILCAGDERYLSSLSAIRAYEQEGSDLNLIFHDSVRPLLSQQILNNVISALNTYCAVDVAIPATDTIIQVNDQLIQAIPNRRYLHQGQTPQAFRLSTIKEAYRLALKDPNFTTTDDCGVVAKYLPNTPIHVVAGDETNMKLTHQKDLFLLDKLFQLKTTDFSTHSVDLTQLKDKVIVVFGAAYGIGKHICSLATEQGAKVYPFSRSINGVDVSSRESVSLALRGVAASEKKIDIVVDTAALLKKAPLANIDYEDIETSIDTNLLGAIIVAKEAYQYLKESKGHLLLYTSSSYTRGRMNYSIYSATKCAIVNFVQAISEEWDPLLIRINCINPERTNTPMRTSNFGMEPEDTLLNAMDVASVSLAVCISNFTGQVIDVKLPIN